MRSHYAKNYRKTFLKVKNIKKVKDISFVAIIGILFVAMWLNLNRFQPDSFTYWFEDKINSIGRGPGFPYDISSHKIRSNNFIVHGDNVLFLSDSAFVALNKSAKQICVKSHNFSNPSFKCSGSRYIIYDVGGNDYRIDTLSKTLRLSSSKNKIVSCDISESGEYGVLSEPENFLSEIAIYDSSGNEKYKYSFANKVASDFSFCSDPFAVSTCGFYTNNGVLTSFLYVHDLKSEHLKYQFDFEDNMLFFVGCFVNGNIAAIGDKGVCVLNPISGLKKEISYEKKELSCFDFDKNQGIVYNILPTNSTKDGEISLLDMYGNIFSNMKCDIKFQSISRQEDKIAALSESKIYLYNLSGNLENVFDTPSISKTIKLSSPKSAYVLQENKIYDLSLR